MLRVVEAIATGVEEVIQEERSLDKVTSFWLKQHKNWDQSEKVFFVEILHGVVRWWRLLNELKFSGHVNFGNQYRNAVTNYLALNFDVTLLRGAATPSYQKKVKNSVQQVKSTRAISQSIPDWLDELGFEELGSRWAIELDALNKSPELIIRANRLKTSREELIGWLKREHYKVSAMDIPDAIHVSGRVNIFKSEAFRLGMFEQQDHSSQQVIPFLEVEPGMRIIDACAGNGGKTLHAASIMGNKGRVIAMDNAEWKLTELRRRIRRAGATNAETRFIESSKTVKRLKDSADRLLLDVPCSGLGVLRRNPDSKWRLTLSRIDELKKIQSDILSRYWVMVKPKGKMVYATCSILPSENEQQVRQFIEGSNGRFVLEDEKKISPYDSGFDGFYMARLRRDF